MIHSTKRDHYWSFCCQGWSNHQSQEVLCYDRDVEVDEAIEVAEAVEVNEAAKVLRPGKLLLRTSKSSRFFNSALFWYFERIIFLVESWNIILNFSTFSFRGCWGHWGCRGSKSWKISTKDFRVIRVLEFSFILMFRKNKIDGTPILKLAMVKR